MFAILGILLVIMIPTYAIMLKKIKEEQVEIPEDQIYKDNFKKEDCINFSGDDLANLKVNHSNHLSKSKYKWSYHYRTQPIKKELQNWFGKTIGLSQPTHITKSKVYALC